MYRYADSDACPACRHEIDRTSPTCATCGVELLGPPARQVFKALQQVDLLVAELPVRAAAPVETVAPAPVAPRSATTTTTTIATPRAAISAASVPTILLGLGALCLLVASIVFMVVAWAALGVGGRTGVMVGFTVVAAVMMRWVARRGLRAGAEAFSAVALGLLAIDLGGAREAGWLGSISDAWFLVLAGSAVLVGSGAIARWSRTTSATRLLSAEVGAILAVGVLAFGAADVLGRNDAEMALWATLVCLAAAAAARWIDLRLVALGALVEATIAWVVLVGAAASLLDPPSIQHVWFDLAVWPTLAAAAVAGLVPAARFLPLWSRVTAAAAAFLVATLAVTVVSFDESATTLALVQLGVVAACGVAVAVLAPAWRWVASVPSVVAAVALVVSVLSMAVVSVETALPTGLWTATLTGTVPGPQIPWTWPLLLPVGVVGVCACVATVLRCASEDPRRVVVPGVALVLAATALVPALYGVPLVVVVLAPALGAAALAAVAIWTGRALVDAAAIALTALALVSSLANPWATAVVLAMVLVGALVAERHPDPLVSLAGQVTAPTAAAGLIWTVGHLAGLPSTWQAFPVVVVLGLVVVLRPGWEREVVLGTPAAVAVAASVVVGGTPHLGWLAAYLTLAGVVVTVSALIHPSRRVLARVGLVFFTGAQWVRLDQLGVETVEAYTLPLALVLLLVGAVALARGAGSSVRALGSGLALALVPTLLLVLAEPVGLRAVLLGAACVLLIAVGLLGRLAAPLAAGATVGAVLVLREGTLAQALPQWALIGLVGVGLTVVGITWEQRLRELRQVSSYVRGLR